MSNSTKDKAKLNIFALPNQTTLLFWLMITVLLGTVFLGSIGSSPVLIWPLALGLMFLPLRAFLAKPDRNFKRYKLKVAGDDFIPIQKAIDTHAEILNLKNIPKLVICMKAIPLYTFGTFRRWYIAVSHNDALFIQDQLTDPESAPRAQAMIIHELYHFKSGDYWKMGYTGELLKTTFLFLGWGIAFFYGLGLLMVVAAPDFLELSPPDLVSQIESSSPDIRQIFIQLLPSEVEMMLVRQKASEINISLVLNFILSAFLPLVLVASVMHRFYWPKLWRTREFYADAGVVHTQGKIKPFLLSFTRDRSIKEREKELRQREDRRFPDWLKNLYHSIRDFPGSPAPSYGAYTEDGFATLSANEMIKSSPGQKVLTWWRRVTSFHPEVLFRIGCVKNPSLVFDSWWGTAILVGSLTLLLDILLSSPLTLIHVGSWPMHFSTLIILVTVSIGYLLPKIVQGHFIWFDLLKLVGVVVGMRLAWVLITILVLFMSLFFAPTFLSEALEATVASVAHYAGYFNELVFSDLFGFVIKASFLNLAQVFVIFIILMTSLSLIAYVLRRLMTWYEFPLAEKQLMKIALLAILVGAVFCGLTILPPATLVLLHPADLLEPSNLKVELMGFVLASIGLGLFIFADRKYSGMCPACSAVINGFYWLGRCCENDQCNERLFSWLIAEYET